MISGRRSRRERGGVEYRSLGATGFRVSVLGLGCNRLGSALTGRARSEMVRLLEEAVDAGVTFYDTADVYADGESERLLGEVLGARPVVIATKVGSVSRVPSRVRSWAQPLTVPIWRRALWLREFARWALGRQDLAPASVRLAVDGSRRRLRRERLDIVHLHNPPPDVTRLDDVLETLERMKAEGAIACYGVSFGTWPGTPPRPPDPRLPVVQVPVGAGRGAGGSAVRWAASGGAGVIGNQPFANGHLFRSDGRDAARRATRARGALVEAVREPGLSVVIAGTTSREHLRDNVAAVDAAR
jgi:aryl-alcohol dehydrogenase-like predicted oxidoreductase